MILKRYTMNPLTGTYNHRMDGIDLMDVMKIARRAKLTDEIDILDCLYAMNHPLASGYASHVKFEREINGMKVVAQIISEHQGA